MVLFKFVTFVVPGKNVGFRLIVALLSAYKRASLSSVGPKTQHSCLRHAHAGHPRTSSRLTASCTGRSLSWRCGGAGVKSC